jgi:hypothetical protein
MNDSGAPNPPSASESYLKHLTVWQSATALVREEKKLTNEGELRFAEHTVKFLTIANAGGVIAIPPAVALFKFNIETDVSQVVATAIVFAFGLTCALMTSILAYFALARLGAHQDYRLEEAAAGADLVMAFHRDNDAADIVKRRTGASEKSAAARRSAQKVRKWAIGFALLSLLSFFSGVTLGGYWTAKHRAAETPNRAVTPAAQISPSANGHPPSP